MYLYTYWLIPNFCLLNKVMDKIYITKKPLFITFKQKLV